MPRIDPVSDDPIPRTTRGSEPEPLDRDEDDVDGACDGDDLDADDRCDCGALLALHDGMFGLCAECREDEDDEFTDDDEEYD